MVGTWHNNLISKKLYEEYGRDFSICDIDGICRKFYKENGVYIQRLIIYESKNDHETIKGPQLQTLFELDNSIDWSKFDEHSGLFVIRIVDNSDVNELEIMKIKKVVNLPPKFTLEIIKKITFDQFYYWISAKDKI